MQNTRQFSFITKTQKTRNEKELLYLDIIEHLKKEKAQLRPHVTARDRHFLANNRSKAKRPTVAATIQHCPGLPGEGHQAGKISKTHTHHKRRKKNLLFIVRTVVNFAESQTTVRTVTGL